jgi:anti-sigma B factor antagonist
VSVNEVRAVRAGELKLEVSQYGETSMIQLKGELDLANAPALEQELDQALRDGTGRVVVDLGELDFIDSTGIALLLNSLDGEEENRVRFLRSQSTAVNRVLALTGVDERLPFIDGTPA